MNSRTLGYRDGYLWKQALLDGASVAGTALTGTRAAAGFAGESLATLLPWVLLSTAAAGAGTGLAHSKLTSPSKTEQETAQKALEVADLEQFATELERRKQQALREDYAMQDEKETGSARTLRI